MLPIVSSWTGFCDSLDHHSPSLCLGSQYEERLDDKSEEIFSSEISVRVTDLSEGHREESQQRQGCDLTSTSTSPSAKSTSGRTSELLSSALKVRSRIDSSVTPRVRIISIFSEFTLDPLQVSSGLLQWIFRKYSVPVEFLEVVLCFGDGPGTLEGCSNHVCKIRNDDKQDLAYELKYYQGNGRGGVNPWSLRHTGVLHCRRKELDVFIIFQPVPDRDSVFEHRLQKLQSPGIQQIVDDPFRVHALMLTSYLGNWRSYLNSVGDQFEERKNRALVIKFGSESYEDSRYGFEAVRDLHGLQDKVSMAEACCESYVRIFEILQESEVISPSLDVIQYYMDNVRGFSKSLASVQRRIDNATALQGYAVNLRYQAQANELGSKVAEMNEEVRDLAKSAQKDSFFITVITILGAIYIPGGFIAAIFGTNFFSFDPVSHNLNIASNFWIFVVAWILLTGVTILIFLMVFWWNAWVKKTSVRWPWNDISRRHKQRCEKREHLLSD